MVDEKHQINREKGVFSRGDCSFQNGIAKKNLNIFNTDLKDILIIDNNPENFSFQPQNGLPIQTWIGNKNDTELVKISELLIFLSNVDDVRTYISKIVSNQTIDYGKLTFLKEFRKQIEDTSKNYNNNIHFENYSINFNNIETPHFLKSEQNEEISLKRNYLKEEINSDIKKKFNNIENLEHIVQKAIKLNHCEIEEYNSLKQLLAAELNMDSSMDFRENELTDSLKSTNSANSLSSPLIIDSEKSYEKEALLPIISGCSNQLFDTPINYSNSQSESHNLTSKKHENVLEGCKNNDVTNNNQINIFQNSKQNKRLLSSSYKILYPSIINAKVNIKENPEFY